MTNQPTEPKQSQFHWYVTYVITRRIQVGKQLGGMQITGSILISLDHDVGHEDFPIHIASQYILTDTKASEVVVLTWSKMSQSLFQEMVSKPTEPIKC